MPRAAVSKQGRTGKSKGGGWNRGGTSWNKGDYLLFAKARVIVRKLKLGSHREWQQYCITGGRPSNIPGKPNETYRDDGWISYPDWLGYKGQARGRMMPFAEARAFVRKLKLTSQKGWKAWRKSGKRPNNIPGNPGQTYMHDGWISCADWLGYGSEGGVGGSGSSSSSSSSKSALKAQAEKKDKALKAREAARKEARKGAKKTAKATAKATAKTTAKVAEKKTQKKRKRQPAAPKPDAPPSKPRPPPRVRTAPAQVQKAEVQGPVGVVQCTL